MTEIAVGDGPQPPTLAQLSVREQARRQLLALFPTGLKVGEWYELRCLDCSRSPAGIGPRSFFRSVSDLVQAALKHRDRWDVFYGVGIRRCPVASNMNRCPHKGRGADHISRLPAAWADFDVRSEDEPDKPHASLDGLIRTLVGSSLPPTILVGSGTGVHAYWPLDAPTVDLSRVERINHSIRDRFRGDNAIDAARILRVAGTFNRKHGNPLPVRLLRCGRG